MTTKRIYVVNDTGAVKEAECLVRAANVSQAIRHVTRSRYKVEVASQDQLVALLKGGAEVQEIDDEEQMDLVTEAAKK